jgi:hypothetical protein
VRELLNGRLIHVSLTGEMNKEAWRG